MFKDTLMRMSNSKAFCPFFVFNSKSKDVTVINEYRDFMYDLDPYLLHLCTVHTIIIYISFFYFKHKTAWTSINQLKHHFDHLLNVDRLRE